MTSRIRAAGAVVLDDVAGRKHVLLVHRKAYDDWTIPKGKALPDEIRPVTAVREVREESGVIALLGARLTGVRYQVNGRTKTVDYWRARPAARFYRAPDKEVDEVRWVPVDKAEHLLTYPDEVSVLHEALTLPATTALALVRHAKAMQRKHWSGVDQARRLSGRGRRQAEALIPMLEAFGIDALVSSPAVRCVETLAPYGRYRYLVTQTIALLTEEEGTSRPDAVAECVRSLVSKLSVPTALCGHRPVLPAMHLGLGIENHPMVVSEVTVLHRDSLGRNVVVEHHKPTA